MALKDYSAPTDVECEACDHQGYCVEHPPTPCVVCGALAFDYASDCDHVWCDEHKAWVAARDLSGPGFAGGTIYHVEFSCGCNEHDESDDLRAAR